MEKPHSTSAYPKATAEMPRGVNRQVLVGEGQGRREEKIGMESKSLVAGVIVDSWFDAIGL